MAALDEIAQALADEQRVAAGPSPSTFHQILETLRTGRFTPEEIQAFAASLGHLQEVPLDGGASTLWSTYLEYLKEEARRVLNSGDERQQFIRKAVSAKTHAVEILRRLSEPNRPSDLRRATGLEDAQIHRVLGWAESQALVWRWKTELGTYYRTTSFAEHILKELESVPWLSMAAVLTRIAVKHRVLAIPIDSIQKEAADLTGLTASQAGHAVSVFVESMSPQLTSRLAPRLRPAGMKDRGFVVCPIIYPEPLQNEVLLKARTDTTEAPFERNEGYYAPRLDALAESFVHRAIARAGLDMSSLTEWKPQDWLERCESSDEPVFLDDDRPIISLSSPLANPVSLELLLRFGSAAYFDHRVSSTLRCDGDPSRKPFYLSDKMDHGLCARFIDRKSGFSAFVLAGMKPSGTYAAARFFYERIESLLDRHGDAPFTYVISVARGYEDRNLPPEITELKVRHPRPPAVEDGRLDMRYLDALPLITDTYMEGNRSQNELFKQLQGTLKNAPDEIHQFAERRVLRGRQSGDFRYELARDLALVLAKHGRFECFLVGLLARTYYKLKGGHETITDDMPPEIALNSVLGKTLHLAAYSRSAIKKLLNKRQWVESFLEICATGTGEIPPATEERATAASQQS